MLRQPLIERLAECLVDIEAWLKPAPTEPHQDPDDVIGFGETATACHGEPVGSPVGVETAGAGA